MPKPRTGENRDDFISRCISEVADEGITGQEAVGRCFGIWESEKSNSVNKLPRKEQPPEKKRIDFDSFQIKRRDVIVDNEEMEVATFEGVANVMETEDLGGDVIHRGAFKKSIEEKDGRVPFVTDHTYRIDNFLGIAHLEEQGNLLKTKVEVLISNNEAGRSFLSKAKFANFRGEPLGLSIGYDVPKGKSEVKDGVRHIYEVKVHEISAVVFPMNQGSRAVGFKGMSWDEIEDTKAQLEELLELKGHSLGDHLTGAINEMAATDQDRKRIIGELAEEAGMSRDRVAEVLNGDMIRPSDQVLAAFSAVLDVPMQQLLTLADNDIGKTTHEDDMKQHSKESKGVALARALNEAIDAMLEDNEDLDKADVIAEMADAAGIAPNTVENILSADIIRPPDDRLRGFAEVLDISFERLQSLAEQDAGKAIQDVGSKYHLVRNQSEDEIAIQELHDEVKSLLNDEPPTGTHDQEAGLSEALQQLKQINQT